MQQECDIGIAELLHMLAIWTQQACSAGVMVWPAVMQTASGCANRAATTPVAMNCSALRDMTVSKRTVTRVAGDAVITITQDRMGDVLVSNVLRISHFAPQARRRGRFIMMANGWPRTTLRSGVEEIYAFDLKYE